MIQSSENQTNKVKSTCRMQILFGISIYHSVNMARLQSEKHGPYFGPNLGFFVYYPSNISASKGLKISESLESRHFKKYLMDCACNLHYQKLDH